MEESSDLQVEMAFYHRYDYDYCCYAAINSKKQTGVVIILLFFQILFIFKPVSTQVPENLIY
jgi:hypothetical protein